MSKINHILAISQHAKFIKNLNKKMAERDLSFTPKACTACDFGLWLYGEVLPKANKAGRESLLEAANKVEFLHREFHENAQRSVDAMREGDYQSMRSFETVMMQKSNLLITALFALDEEFMKDS